MKTVADLIAKSNLTDCPEIQDLLVRPAKNHSDKKSPMVERFVIQETKKINLLGIFSDEEKQMDIKDFEHKLILPQYWVDLPDLNCGFLVNETNIKYIHYAEILGKGVTNLVWNAKLTNRKVESFETCKSLLNSFNGREEFQAAVQRSMTVFAVANRLLTSHRFVTTERVTPKDETFEQRSALRRAAQRGRPIFSLNVVNVIAPATCEHRGVIKPMSSFAGMRGHWVVGHWRLIDGQLEPYAIWIDPHRRGNDDLGGTCSDRRLRFSKTPEVRRGYLMPNFVGRPGQRVPVAPLP